MRHATAMIEYTLLASIMTALILTAAQYAGMNLSAPFEMVAASLDEPTRILNFGPSSAPAAAARSRPTVKHDTEETSSWAVEMH